MVFLCQEVVDYWVSLLTSYASIQLFYFFVIQSWHVSMTFSISSRLSKSLAYNFSQYSLILLSIFVALVVHACLLSCFSHGLLFVTLWATVASQASLSMGFSRQKYWSELPYSPLGNLLNPGIEPMSLMSHALAGRFFTTSTTWETQLW